MCIKQQFVLFYSCPCDIQSIMILVLLNSPQERLATYKCWPVHPLYLPYPLALAGFSYTGRDNIVKCFTCSYTASVNSWSPSLNPSEAHSLYSPECSFVSGLKMYLPFDTTFPIDANSMCMKDKHSFRDTHLTIDSILAETNTSPTNACKLTDGSVVRLKYPQFESVVSRMQTYENWSYSSIQQPIILAEAGYFHTGNIIAILKSQEVGVCTLVIHQHTLMLFSFQISSTSFVI